MHGFAHDAVDFITDRSKLENDGWGPWHEIGHQHQQSAITWNETVEVTVNIYSLAVERMLGQTSRLKRENRWEGILAYLDQPMADKNYNDPSIGPFLRRVLPVRILPSMGCRLDDSYFEEVQALNLPAPEVDLLSLTD